MNNLNNLIDNKKIELSRLVNSLQLYDEWEFKHSFVLDHYIGGTVKGNKLKMLFNSFENEIDDQFLYRTYFYIIRNLVIVTYIDGNGVEYDRQVERPLFANVLFNALVKFK